ncbi:hypothetical protein FEM54_31695 [Pseudomonas edaphica]|uniref:Uncharacterized protein n=1 Tax=Pseudomonas edaphica TaxID=2006980 RepID=A0ABY2TVR9_9PSED|nr:hypothetical protein FEM54_31695 [Pseudomonas edaphica]
MADADRQAFGRMCLDGRFREQARSHMGSAVLIQFMSRADQNVGAGLLANSTGTSAHQPNSHPFNTNRIIVCAAAS